MRMKKTIKFNEFLEFIADNESFSETLREFSGMTRQEIKGLLLTYGRNPKNPDIDVIIDQRQDTAVGFFVTTNYQIFVDGASRGNPGPSGVGAVFYDGKDEVKRLKKYIGETTNNVAEYEALIMALKEALKMKFYSIRVFSDSELLVKQINGEYRVLDPDLERLYKRAYKEIHKFTSFRLKHLGRRSNKLADQLANEAIDDEGK
jgi:ribonuclease HI